MCIRDSFKDTDITGTINAVEDGVMFTSIPYVDGWHVFVDGKAVDKVDIGNRGVIGVDITKGEHLSLIHICIRMYRHDACCHKVQDQKQDRYHQAEVRRLFLKDTCHKYR